MFSLRRLRQGWPMKTLEEELRTFGFVTLGCFIYAVAVTLFVAPARLPATGITGVSLYLHYHWGWSLGITSAAFNALLFIYAWRALSRRFLWWSLYATALLSVLFEVTPLLPILPINDPMLLVLVAGVLQGMAFAMVFSVGASTGGTDIITVSVKRKTGIEVGSISMVINFAVLGLFIFEIPHQKLLYGMVMTYVASMVTNTDLRSFGVRKEAMIVTAKVDMVRRYIVEELHRGVTLVEARGGYDGQPRTLLISLLSPRQALGLKLFLKANDPTAFMRLSETSEVLGSGFRSWQSDL